jgi:HNH endonuclease
MDLQQFYRICDSIEPDEYGCHNYPGATSGFYFGVNITGQRFRVNRLALERKLGRPIKPNHFACHECHNKCCVNQGHLFEGTNLENIRHSWATDPEYRNIMIEKGRKLGQSNHDRYYSDSEFRANLLKNLANGWDAPARNRALKDHRP